LAICRAISWALLALVSAALALLDALLMVFLVV